MSLGRSSNRIRASLLQRETMVEFMEKHPELGNERLSSCYDIRHRKQKWLELTKILNRLPGKSKTEVKWQKAWQDWRYNTRKKQYFQKTNLSVLEKRIMDILNLQELRTKDEEEEEEEIAEIETVRVKQEDVSNEDFGDILEARLVELSSSSGVDQLQIENVTTLSNSTEYRGWRRNPKKKFVPYDTFYGRKNIREIHRVAKCVEKSAQSVLKFCKTQAENSAKIALALEENSRTLQNLVESQMRQAEALERQVSLEESRNSILKLIASSLASLKNK